VADYVRDTLGRISQIGLTRPGQARQVVVNDVSYAAFGPATGWTYGNGRQLQRPLDLDYRPQAVHDPAAGGLSLGFGYDAVGSITELKNGTGSAVLAKYAYDTLGRLTHTQDGATGTPIETYAYDATGNRTALTTSAGTTSYTYPATSHRLTAVDGEARSHDAVGNTTSIGSKAFTYNDANRMSAVKRSSAVLESYGYNHRGERVLRAAEGGNAQITVYDEAGQWLGNYSATGVAQQQAIWLDSYPVALINVPSTGAPELAYIQPDHLGTPRVVIDPVRDVAIWEWSSKSEVFGDQAPTNDPDGDGVAFDVALRFPGQQATAASGLFYNYQREYDPAVGRYSQSDPIGLEGGIATFSYALNDPNSQVDLYGLQALRSGMQIGSRAIMESSQAYSSGGQSDFRSSNPRGNLPSGFAAMGNALNILSLTHSSSVINPQSNASILVGSIVSTACENDDEDCSRLVAKIDSLVIELRKRYWDLKQDKLGLPATGRMSIDGHVQQFQNKQAQLRRLLAEASTKRCAGYSNEAWSWATMSQPM